MKNQCIDIGYRSSETDHCFVIDIQPDFTKIYERKRWFDAPKDAPARVMDTDVLRFEVPSRIWSAISTDVRSQAMHDMECFDIHPNRRINLRRGTYLCDRCIAKEIMVLLWGIEPLMATGDYTRISNAVSTWQRYSSEELWWLYTMANSECGANDDSTYGSNGNWRRALHCIFA